MVIFKYIVFIIILIFNCISFLNGDIMFNSNSKYWENIYVYSEKEKTIRAIVPEEEDINKNYFSVNDKYLVYREVGSRKDRSYGVFFKNLESGSNELILKNHENTYIEFDLSSSRDRFLFIRSKSNINGETEQDLFLYNITSKKITQLTNTKKCDEARWIDNNKILCINDNNLYILNKKNKKMKPLTNDNLNKMSIVVSNDKKYAYYISKEYVILDPMLGNLSLKDASVFRVNLENGKTEKYNFFDKTIEMYSCDLHDDDSILYLSVSDVNGNNFLYSVDLKTKKKSVVFEDDGYITNVRYHNGLNHPTRQRDTHKQ